MNQTDNLLCSPAAEQWKSVGVCALHGLVIPLFSLHSEKSCGIGEFPDLLPIIEWCHALNLRIIQLLPLNDSGPDTSPYGAISAFALNPIHLGLSHLLNVEQHSSLLELLVPMRGWNASQRVDYPKIHAAKEQFLREYFRLLSPQIVASPEYQRFLKENGDWLYSYALFKAIKITRDWQPWEEWGPELSWSHREELLQVYAPEIVYHLFVQYLCFQQLAEVKGAAERQRIFIKGDIPILISRQSADVWANQEIFQMNYSAGAPPDMYAEKGQDWGFPIYNWPEIERRGYVWWKRRLQVASQFYHLYRVDHIVGFFHIWAIPLGKKGSEGYYIPEESSWIPQGKAILLMMINNSPMLPIGEDLGNVPPEVRSCLRELGISGTKVMRWERRYREDKGFILGIDYPAASLTTVSTHDSETLLLWWRDNPAEAKDYAAFKGWNYTKELDLLHHWEILYDSHHTSSVFHINLLSEYLVHVPSMTWPKLEDERINIPGVISDRNWSYRFRPSVEEIVTSHRLRQVIEGVVWG